MKIVTVSLREQSISPKKARLVMNYIKNTPAEKGLVMLKNLNKKTAKLAYNLLKSGVDAAQKKDFQLNDLVITESIAQDGRRMKRFYIRARGRSAVFHKRTVHLKISLSNKAAPKIEEKAKKDNRKTDKMKEKGITNG
ncbi:MAG: uL22 family ribosomal protein [Candidatus Berkelbacteria bacterium]|nr:uL22 family ribosomal protein [Candidatus Berkelbacteria bacterium]